MSNHSRAWWIASIFTIIVSGAITCALWQGGSNAEIKAQSDAMRKASGSRLRVKSFCDAVDNGNVSVVQSMLSADPSLANATDADGATALHHAAWENNTPIITLLLNHGGKIDHKGPYGTPLEWAVYSGSLAAAQLLIEHGAKPDAEMLVTAERGTRGAINGGGHTPRTNYAGIAVLLQKSKVPTTPPVLFMGRLNDPHLPIKPIASPILGEWPKTLVSRMNADGNLLPQLLNIGTTARRVDEGLMLFDSREYTGALTPQTFSAPIEIDIVVKTDGADVRLYFGPADVIFNYGYQASELFVGDPAKERFTRIKNRGSIPVKQFVTIKWVFQPDSMAICVNNDLRYQSSHDYRNVQGRIGIGPALRSTITVGSMTVKPLPSATTKDSL